jgi:hypothetical protein
MVTLTIIKAFEAPAIRVTIRICWTLVMTETKKGQITLRLMDKQRLDVSFFLVDKHRTNSHHLRYQWHPQPKT